MRSVCRPCACAFAVYVDHVHVQGRCTHRWTQHDMVSGSWEVIASQSTADVVISIVCAMPKRLARPRVQECTDLRCLKQGACTIVIISRFKGWRGSRDRGLSRVAQDVSIMCAMPKSLTRTRFQGPTIRGRVQGFKGSDFRCPNRYGREFKSPNR